MKMLKIAVTLILATATLGTSAASAAHWEESQTVKVTSWSVAEASHVFAESGLLFRHQDRVYVVASEHGIIHGKEGYAIHVSGRALKEVSAELLAADWGWGLALLRLPVDAAAPVRVLELEDLRGRLASVGESLVLSGFPQASRRWLGDSSGKVLDPASERHDVPLVPNLIEVAHGHGEYGMSGGPAFGLDHRLLGLLSHQFLSMVPGSPMEALEFGPESTQIENHLLVIPAAQIYEWVKKYLNSPVEFHSAFVRDPKAQLKGQERVCVAGLALEYGVSSDPADPARGVGGTGPVGVGGTGPVGIGGTGPVGVGGAGTSIPDGVVRITQSRTCSELKSSWQLLAHSGWFTSLQSRLEAGVRVEVPVVMLLDSEHLKLTGTRFHSLSQFISLIARGAYLPVSRLESQASSSSPSFSALQEAAQGLLTLSSKLLEGGQAGLTSGSAAHSLLRRLRLIGWLSRSDEALLLPDAILADALGQKSGWDELFGSHFDDTVSLMKAVRQIREELATRRH